MFLPLWWKMKDQKFLCTFLQYQNRSFIHIYWYISNSCNDQVFQFLSYKIQYAIMVNAVKNLNVLTNLLSWFASGLVGSNAIIFPLPLLGAFWYRDILHHDFYQKLFTLISHKNDISIFTNFLYYLTVSSTISFFHFKKICTSNFAKFIF